MLRHRQSTIHQRATATQAPDLAATQQGAGSAPFDAFDHKVHRLA